MAIRFGLIGAGRMGKVFAHTLAFNVAEADLVALADANEQTSTEVAGRYNVKDHYTDYRKLLDRKDIDAVVITTPTSTHVEVIKAAAAAGKQIFTEKPLGDSLKACDDAMKAVKESGVQMQVGFMRRYDPAYKMAKQKIDEGLIGKPVLFKSISRDPHRTSLEFAKRENSGGLILDMGVHDFDLARWLMGSEVDTVYSIGGALVYPELKEVGDIDNAILSLKMANDTIGEIDLSRNAVYGYDIRTEVLGSDGGLVIGKLQQTSTLMMTRSGVTHDTVPYFMERFGEAYAEEIRDFVDSLLNKRPAAVTGTDARAATAIGIAATLSYDEQRPVKISEIG